ncbi:hypothetical protein [Rhizobium sullae]|uniref:hypothetical protein n=1 Tax=Rhizobium sullae TaxID=50338 RepID=UPI00117A67DB|nr:hypothetical protein [Rhizobium sullae]
MMIAVGMQIILRVNFCAMFHSVIIVVAGLMPGTQCRFCGSSWVLATVSLRKAAIRRLTKPPIAHGIAPTLKTPFSAEMQHAARPAPRHGDYALRRVSEASKSAAVQT